MSERFTYGQLLLVLNYDTHEVTFLTLEQRCLIHRVLCEKATLDDDLVKLIQQKLVEINDIGYQRKICHYVEVQETGVRMLLFD